MTVGIDAERRKQCLLCVGIRKRLIRHYNKSGYAEIIAHIMGQHSIAFNDIWSTVPTMIQSLQAIPGQNQLVKMEYEEIQKMKLFYFNISKGTQYVTSIKFHSQIPKKV
ncbi:Hypothetical_protein [Hexamita inflata]|uniref:Hypothetical_protein n=1 Tax=Hexamita inflata TaxID=28002 RepID=A0AA86PFH1_9EUKA|nr:Hypothetical protein HINF_LOCUS25864 [Hexamita inflata]